MQGASRAALATSLTAFESRPVSQADAAVSEGIVSVPRSTTFRTRTGSPSSTSKRTRTSPSPSVSTAARAVAAG